MTQTQGFYHSWSWYKKAGSRAECESHWPSNWETQISLRVEMHPMTDLPSNPDNEKESKRILTWHIARHVIQASVRLDFLRIRNWCFIKCFHVFLFCCLVNFSSMDNIPKQLNDREKEFDDSKAKIIREILGLQWGVMRAVVVQQEGRQASGGGSAADR